MRPVDFFCKYMKRNRDFHNHVRVVYRACRKMYGVEYTQDECLRIFKVVFPELYKLRNSNEDRVAISQKVQRHLMEIAEDWCPQLELHVLIQKVSNQISMPFDWKRQDLIQFYEDIMPVAMRIRKLTPRETGRLMGLNEEEISIMYAAGLSNSAMYKLHGNSIVVDVLLALFEKLIIKTEQTKAVGTQLSLF